MAAVNTLVIGKMIKTFPLLLIYVNLGFVAVLIIFVCLIILSRFFLRPQECVENAEKIITRL